MRHHKSCPAWNPQWIAEQNGFKPEKLFFEKDDYSRSHIHKLMSYNAIGAVFLEQSLFGIHGEQTVPFDRPKDWKAYSGKLQVNLDIDPAPFMAGGHRALQTDVAKAIAFGELMKLAEEHVVFERESVQFYFHPSEVRAKTQIAKGKLKLIPVTDMAKVTTNARSSATSCLVTGKGTSIYLEPPSRPKGLPTAEEPWKKDLVLCAYWLVKGTSKKEEANLVTKRVTQTDFSFQIYENIKAIKPFEKLVVFEPEEPQAKKAKP